MFLICLPSSLVPEGIPAPLVTDGISRTVLVSWDLPTSPNGIVLFFLVERTFDGSFVQIGSVNGTSVRVFVDQDTVPFTSYQYRIVAVNSAGSGTGASTNFTTPEAG